MCEYVRKEYNIWRLYGNDKDENKYYPFLEVRTKVMDDKIYKSMEIMADIVKNSLFEDNKRIREVIRIKIVIINY